MSQESPGLETSQEAVSFHVISRKYFVIDTGWTGVTLRILIQKYSHVRGLTLGAARGECDGGSRVREELGRPTFVGGNSEASTGALNKRGGEKRTFNSSIQPTKSAPFFSARVAHEV